MHLLVLFLIPGLFGSAEGNFRRVCEHSHMTIDCGSKEIFIQRATYGRTQKGVCVFRGHDGNTWCHAGSSLRVARYRCQRQRSCTLHATNAAFGDPCYGTEKYLDVTYSCVPRTGLHGRLVQVCEGGSHSIHCHGNKRIHIMFANYGRLTGAHVCGGPIRTTNCGAAWVLGKVRGDCQGRPACVLIANNGKFGDPCYGTYKYLEVRYRCQ